MTAFGDLVDDLLATEFERSPVLASGLGLTEYDSRLDDLSASAMLDRDAQAEAWLHRFEDVDERELSPEERIDRGLAIAMMRGRTILSDWAGWRRDPLVYSAPILSGIFTLFLHRLRPAGELVDAAVARLEAAPQALAQGAANLDPTLAHPIILERGVGAAKGGARYLRDLLPLEVADPADRDRLATAARTAAAAFDAWVEHVEGVKREASGDWRLGEARYSRLLKERESLPYDARALRALGQQEYDRLDAEMRDLARTIDGTDDWRALLERANEDRPATEEAMRAAYAEWSERARSFLAETGLVTLHEGERCVVEPSPLFMRPVFGVAFYIAPPAFADTLLGHFFVPFAPEGARPEDVEQRLKANSHGGIPTTAVHEAYPGHHWHLVMRKLAGNRLRSVFGTPYFNEGWGLYTERVMRERGFFREPVQELYHLQATIFRAARIIVDTSLHLGDMEHEEAVEFMKTRVPLPEFTARAEVGRYCWIPTQASAYLTGCLEILRIRDRFLEARGETQAPADVPAAILRDLHDRLASSGSLPLGLAAQAVLGDGAAG